MKDKIEHFINLLNEFESIKTNRLPDALADLDIDDKQARKLANHLYWKYPDISVKAIQTYLCKGKPIKQKPTPIIYTCSLCNQETTVEIKNRSELHEVHNYRYPFVCRCRVIENEEQSKQNLVYFKDYQKRQIELETMPYKDYLQTEEWNDTRKHHLKKAGYKCQLCNQGNTKLHVHHRTYERRGNERYNDLIVLCEKCHGLFHGKQANTVDANTEHGQPWQPDPQDNTATGTPIK